MAAEPRAMLLMTWRHCLSFLIMIIYYVRLLQVAGDTMAAEQRALSADDLAELCLI
jgi:hypothetical protein